MIDKLMEKRGYIKTVETKYGVYYQKDEAQGYTHVVCILNKRSGKHLIQSYEKNMNYTVGLEIDELFILWLKAISMKIKYHWEVNRGASEPICKVTSDD